MTRAEMLDTYLAAHAFDAFDWRVCNCCHFAAGWVAMATGRNAMEGLAATWNKSQAVRLLVRLGGSLQSAISSRLRRVPIAPALAQLGDIVLVDKSVGICCGRTVAVLTPADGLVRVPIDVATHAWRLDA